VNAHNYDIYALHHTIERRALLTPDKVAFRFLNDELTYDALNQKANALCQCLLNLQVKKGDRIGIYMPRSLESIIAVYGIIKAGGVYVPLDPFAPSARTRYVIKDCGIDHVISIQNQVKAIKKILDEDQTIIQTLLGVQGDFSIPHYTWEEIYNLSDTTNNSVRVLEQDLAYILYTSGSTGQPKGIMHTHYSGLAFIKLKITLYGVDEGDIIGMHQPLHFDPSIFGLFAVPFIGGTSVIVSEAHTKMPASLSQLVEKEKITIWFSVPLALTQMLLNGALEQRDMTSLRWVLFSGEVFTTKYLRQLMELWPFARFSNIYGPTEINQCTYYHVGELQEDNPIPIGYVWENSEYKILTKEDKPVVVGEAGELVVRTATMMKGYWNNPTLTQQSFYTETVVPGVTKTYYRTGDQVQLNDKGELLFLGRNDRQIKIRGYRIEMDEIEFLLTQNDLVQEVAVTVIENSEKEKELMAFVLVIPERPLDITVFKSYCKKVLPQYAVPDHIQVLAEFPRTASGKINRKEIEKNIIVH